MLKKIIFASIVLVTTSVAGLALPACTQDATQTQIVQDYELTRANKALVTRALTARPKDGRSLDGIAR